MQGAQSLLMYEIFLRVSYFIRPWNLSIQCCYLLLGIIDWKSFFVSLVTNSSLDGSTCSSPDQAMPDEGSCDLQENRTPRKMPGLYRCNLCNNLFDLVEDLRSHLGMLRKFYMFKMIKKSLKLPMN